MNMEPLVESVLAPVRGSPSHEKLSSVWSWQHFWPIRMASLMTDASGHALQGRISQERWGDR